MRWWWIPDPNTNPIHRSGLTKLSAVDSPLESDIEHIAIQAFGDLKVGSGGSIKSPLKSPPCPRISFVGGGGS